MSLRTVQLPDLLNQVDTELIRLTQCLSEASAARILAWKLDAAALNFHLAMSGDNPPEKLPITVVLGGTGTGKSTLVNRLVGNIVTAASFRRTFTSGPVAVVNQSADLATAWLGVEHIQSSTNEPPRGQPGSLIIVVQQTPVTLVDTPDLDGDQLVNHAQSDRAFRWAQRIIFVVTPEKYQMTELIPYYRLALRYAVPALFVMNKCEEPAVLDDFLGQLAKRGWPDAHVFAIPRDDAAYEPAPEENLQALRAELLRPVQLSSKTGIAHRVADLIARLNDHVIVPLRNSRKQADLLCASLTAMETPQLGVDVNPITEELRRRLQQRSVLYLLGPQRVLDRVRQVPTLLGRLPRATWDWVMRGQMPDDMINPNSTGNPGVPPDFQATLSEQFTVVRSRIDDVMRSSPTASQWIDTDQQAYQSAMIDPATAGMIASDEIQILREWLGKKMERNPARHKDVTNPDEVFARRKKLVKLSEAAPYLLTIALIVHHALFWHIDLPVLGGYTLLTWITERISNEVSARTRATNRKMDNRFESLAHDQIQRICRWMDRQAPSMKELQNLEAMADQAASFGMSSTES